MTSIPCVDGRVTVSTALQVLAAVLDDGGYHEVKTAWYAHQLQRSRPTAGRIIRRLCDLGLLERRTINQRVIEYRMVTVSATKRRKRA